MQNVVKKNVTISVNINITLTLYFKELMKSLKVILTLVNLFYGLF